MKGSVREFPPVKGNCVIWPSHIGDHGYGQIMLGSRTDGSRRLALAHRYVYEMVVGPIPDGLELDHLCRVRACVNPDHLEPVTHAENMRRARPTHCIRGHEFNEENTYVRRDGSGRRICRLCNRLREERRLGKRVWDPSRRRHLTVTEIRESRQQTA